MSKFNFIEKPQKGMDAADTIMPQLSNLSAEEQEQLKGGLTICDAVCLPTGYDYVPPCPCKYNLAVALIPDDPIAIFQPGPIVTQPILITLR